MLIRPTTYADIDSLLAIFAYQRISAILDLNSF